MHDHIRRAVLAACERAAGDPVHLSDVADDEGSGDTIYAIDRVGEAALLEMCERELHAHLPIVVIAEGVDEHSNAGSGAVVLPRGADARDAAWRVIVDPIDGTRGLMYQKRSAWILTGVAPNRGSATRLSDVALAVQSEIPTLKQHLADTAWAAAGAGAGAERWNRLTEERVPLRLQPSRAPTLAHGFATIARFFPGMRDVLAAIDDEIVMETLGAAPPGKAQCFEDQYISTGGQLYELMAGRDRFIADLRPLVYGREKDSRSLFPLCCHPYDLCTELIARELGVIVCDPAGRRLEAPLSIEPDVAWVGYANPQIRDSVEPALRRALERRGLLRDA